MMDVNKSALYQVSQSKPVGDVNESNDIGRVQGAVETTSKDKTPVVEQVEDIGANEVKDAAEKLSTFLEVLSDRALSITIDEELSTIVVKIIDKETSEVIRQIPEEEMLSIVKRMQGIAQELFGDSVGFLLENQV